jgi:hypothetical protein
MTNRLRRVFNPDWYHGKNKKKTFFEGWYYKLVTKDESQALAIIPGILEHPDPLKAKAFIICLEASTKISYFVEFPPDLFSAKNNKFDIAIGGNRFQSDKIDISINRKDIKLFADLSFRHLKPWPVSLLSPGIMGWYAWVPFMECFHGVLSMDHTINGTVIINGSEKDLDGGRGYIEKDWGTAFPEAWIWQQANHFSDDDISLTASIAIIPWIRKPFPGFIIGFLWEGRLFRFATYTGAKIVQLKLNENEVLWIVEDKKYILEMLTTPGSFLSLRAPTPNGMDRQIKESINSTIDVKLYQKIKTGETLIYQGKGRNAGLEMEGNIDRLLNMVQNV